LQMEFCSPARSLAGEIAKQEAVYERREQRESRASCGKVTIVGSSGEDGLSAVGRRVPLGRLTPLSLHPEPRRPIIRNISPFSFIKATSHFPVSRYADRRFLADRYDLGTDRRGRRISGPARLKAGVEQRGK